MFGFFKKRRLFEQQKLLWQNWFASDEMLEPLNSVLDYEKRYSLSTYDETKVFLEDIKDIYSKSVDLMNRGGLEDFVSDQELRELFNNNKKLRKIYESRINVSGPLSMPFDVFARPVYGWDNQFRSN